MKKMFYLALLMLCLMPYTNCLADQRCSDWEMVMNKNGIMAYSRKVSGSGIFEFRAVMVVDARAEVVAEALRDIPAMTEWLPDCDNAFVINKSNRNDFSTYFSLDLPWPVKDRDVVMYTTTKYDLDHARAVTDFITFEEAAPPPRKSHIRMPYLKGQYVFEYVTREKTGIVQTYRADIGGSIPEWMANFVTKYNIYKTFMNMKELFKKEKYIKLAKTSPDREICESFQTNREETKNLLLARLREFIHDTDFLDMIRDSRALDDLLDTGNGQISETLLYGWGSDESKEKAIRFVLKSYLSGRTCDNQLMETALDDDDLIRTILKGPGPTEKPSRQIIEAYLQTGPNVASNHP